MKLEHRPVTVSAATGRSAVEIAGGIEDQAGQGSGPVRAVAEVMQHRLRPSSARCGRQLEHCAATIGGTTAGSAAIPGRAVEIAGGIEDQAGVGIIPVRAVGVEAI